MSHAFGGAPVVADHGIHGLASEWLAFQHLDQFLDIAGLDMHDTVFRPVPGRVGVAAAEEFVQIPEIPLGVIDVDDVD